MPIKWSRFIHFIRYSSVGLISNFSLKNSKLESCIWCICCYCCCFDVVLCLIHSFCALSVPNKQRLFYESNFIRFFPSFSLFLFFSFFLYVVSSFVLLQRYCGNIFCVLRMYVCVCVRGVVATMKPVISISTVQLSNTIEHFVYKMTTSIWIEKKTKHRRKNRILIEKRWAYTHAERMVLN